MKQIFAKAAIVALGVMFAEISFAQTQNEPAKLSAEETTKVSNMTKAEFHQLCLRSWAVEHMNDQSGKRRDKEIITSEQCPGDTLIEKATDKDGFSWVGGPMYQFNSGLNGFGFVAGGSYTTVGENGLGFRGDVLLGATRTKFNDNSIYAGDSFLAMTVSPRAYFSFLKLNKHDTDRFWIGGGAEWNWAPSESKPVEMEDGSKMRLNTKTFTAHGLVEIMWQHRFYNTGNSFSLSFGWKEDRTIWQNDGQSAKGVFFVKGLIEIGGWRHKTRNTGSQLW